MKGFADMMAGLIPVDFMKQAEKFFSDIGSLFTKMDERQKDIDEKLDRIVAQCVRIEANTLMLLDEAGGTVAAAPTDYQRPILDRLPPFNGVSHE